MAVKAWIMFRISKQIRVLNIRVFRTEGRQYPKALAALIRLPNWSRKDCVYTNSTRVKAGISGGKAAAGLPTR
jgi:hypothetical protein